MTRCLKFTLFVAMLASASLPFAAAASASTDQFAVLEDSARVLSADPAQRDAALNEMRTLGADVVKVPVEWRKLAPSGESLDRPSFDGAEPSNYSWTLYDNIVSAAQARGLAVWMMITAPAPRWAVAKEPPPYIGSYKPDPGEYGDFVTAVGKHFSGVNIWSIWNEPNLPRFLQPQYKKGVVLSAVHYRKMYRAAHASLAASGHGSDTILFGELLPRGPDPAKYKKQTNTPPIMWLREFFCLDPTLKPRRGSDAKKHKCTGFKRIETSGFAYHPYTTPKGPLASDPIGDNATVGYLARVHRVLKAAGKRNKLGNRRLPIYNSEFGFQTNPPDRFFAPIAKVPAFMNIGELISFQDPLVASYSQYLLVDDLALTGFQSGLRFSDGSPKPGIYDAYRIPVYVTKLGPDSVRVWGCLRGKVFPTETAEIQVLQNGAYATVSSVPVTNNRGYFVADLPPLAGASSLQWRVKWGSITSRTTTAGKRVAGSKKLGTIYPSK